MSEILTIKFFEKNTLVVAKSLLGKFLCRRRGRKIIRAMITEIEAYDGFKDKASHAARGKTKRNAPMFGPAGYWYVYFTYGMHWMLNVVTGKKGYPAAVLIRGVQYWRRPTSVGRRTSLRLNGPGRVTKFLKIDKRFNGKFASRRTGLWIEDGGVKISKGRIAKGKRVGIDYAGPIWSEKKYRFFVCKR